MLQECEFTENLILQETPSFSNGNGNGGADEEQSKDDDDAPPKESEQKPDPFDVFGKMCQNTMLSCPFLMLSEKGLITLCFCVFRPGAPKHTVIRHRPANSKWLLAGC